MALEPRPQAIGIDLGTTNSAAAHYAPASGDPRILTTNAGENLTPSVVGLQKGKLVVGRPAVNNAPRDPSNTVFSVKRLMGRAFSEPKVAEVRDHFNYRIAAAEGDDPGLLIVLGDKSYKPQDISSMILAQIRGDATSVLGHEVTHAVITVPAYFEERQRAATREAGQLAGLTVKKIIDEPTAAAVAFSVRAKPGERHRILVFDLGGGTFDISILLMVKDETGRDQFQVLKTMGDNWLGGDDFDREILGRLVASVKENIESTDAFDPTADKRFLLLAKQHAEEAKRALAANDEVDIVIPAACRAPDGSMVDVDYTLSRTDFDDMIRPYVERTMELTRQALADQDLEAGDISDVLLVGGSTLTPLVYETVQAYFGENKVRRNVNPMECVALGASVLATTLHGVECPNEECKEVNEESATECSQCGTSLAAARAVGDSSITETTPMSLGISVVKGEQADVFAPIIPKDTVYPLREPMKRTFLPTDGRRIRVPVFEGDDTTASRNEEQGVIEYDLPTEIGVNTNVEVSFNYDRNRQLTVTIQVQGRADLCKTETLRRDLPRTAPPEDDEQEESWEEALQETVMFVQYFLETYGQYMDVAARAKIEGDLQRATGRGGVFDETEGRRLDRVLQMNVFNSGVASQIYLAERAMDGAPPEISEKLSRAVNALKDAHGGEDDTRVHQLTAALRPLVAQTLERRTGVKEIGDQKDFGGLLRLLEER